MTPDGRRDGATLVKWMGIEDANTAGFVHGGTVMRLCGHPTAVPPHEPAGEVGRRREREAQLRRANRLAERDEILSQRSG